MARKLPTMKYKNKKCVVDFRLAEMRCGKEMKPIKFTRLKGGPKSKVKKKLRGIRFRTWSNVYIPGVDD